MDDPYGVSIKPRASLTLHKFNERKRCRRERTHREILMNLSSDSEEDEVNYGNGTFIMHFNIYTNR